MSHTKPKRKPAKTNAHGLRTPRQSWALDNPIGYAILGAAKPHQEEIKEITNAIEQAATAMREGRGTANDWGIIAGSLSMAISIELGGIVRGFSEEWADYKIVSQDIHDRAMLTGQWQRTTLWAAEIKSMRNFIRHHSFQLQQLSRSELETAINRAQAKIKSEGFVAEVVRDVQAFEQERIAA
jgi:hypothetical protein